MSTELAVIERGIGTAIAQMQSRSVLIRQVMANVLEEGKDYGKIPGTDKPTLLKPGAEKLCLTFSLAPAMPVVEDLSSTDAVRYRVNVPIEASDGRVLAVGVGECSTDEEKYRWRRPVCDEEFEDTPDHLKRLKWFHGKGSNPAFQGKQVRTSPADVANTVLKMAHKRAFVGGTLMATGASSVFNQDVEDFAKELHANVIDEEGPEPTKVRRASERKAAAGGGALVTPPLKVRDVKVFGKDKNNYAVSLVGHADDYTTKNAKMALDLEGFKGTDHLVQLTFENNDFNGKTYHNIKSFAVVEPAPAPTTPPPAADSPPPMTSADIPFGK